MRMAVKNYSDLKSRLDARLDYLPLCADYSKLLDWAIAEFGIKRTAVQCKYGNYTCTDWKKLFSGQRRKSWKMNVSA